MRAISVKRAAGLTRDAAIGAVAVEFEAFATDGQDLAKRRRVLQADRALATFAFDLGDLKPESVERLGKAYCVNRGGNVTLAPSSRVAAQIATEAQRCERHAGSTDPSCFARAVQVDDAPVARKVRRPTEGRSTPAIQPFYEFALSYGGDTIASVQFVGGATQDIDTGNGVTFGGGIIQRINDSFGIKYTGGYKVSFSAATNADIMKSVATVDIIPYYRWGDHKIGAGISRHLSPKVDWDWLAPTTRFDDATGVTVEYAFRRFGVSYTDIDYKIGNASLYAGNLSFKYSSKY